MIPEFQALFRVYRGPRRCPPNEYSLMTACARLKRAAHSAGPLFAFAVSLESKAYSMACGHVDLAMVNTARANLGTIVVPSPQPEVD